MCTLLWFYDGIIVISVLYNFVLFQLTDAASLAEFETLVTVHALYINDDLPKNVNWSLSIEKSQTFGKCKTVALLCSVYKRVWENVRLDPRAWRFFTPEFDNGANLSLYEWRFWVLLFSELWWLIKLCERLFSSYVTEDIRHTVVVTMLCSYCQDTTHRRRLMVLVRKRTDVVVSWVRRVAIGTRHVL